MKRHTASQIKARVRKLLQENRIRRPPVRVQLIAKNLGIHIRHEPFEGDISGVLYRDKNMTIVGVNSLHHRNRQRFTTAHEIGHLLLHEIDVHVDKVFRMVLRDSDSSQATDPKEIEANQFAAELLMPEHMLEQDVPAFLNDFENEAGLEKLANLYQVSAQAMAFRLANMGVIKLEV
jgi:Zn-dependent peptidase ImmA (M78 family)